MFFLLSEVPGRGHIKQCPRGCVHFTYGPMTLHFRDANTLTLVAERWGETLENSEPGDAIELCYGIARFVLTSNEAREVGRMLRQAVPASVAVMSGALIARKEDDEDSSDEWPEGDVPVSIPADFALPRREPRKARGGGRMIEPQYHQQHPQRMRWTPDRLLERDPEQYEALLLRARHWGRSGLPECARAELCDLLARDPESLEVRMSLAGLLLLCGEYATAIDHMHYVARRCAEETDGAGAQKPSAPIATSSPRRQQRQMQVLWDSYTNDNEG